MQAWPRIHSASAAIGPEGCTAVAGPEPAAVATFDGAADMEGGSPETLLTSALAWSYARAVRAEAAQQGLEWDSLEVTVDGTIDRNRRGTRFSGFDVSVVLDCPGTTSAVAAPHWLERALGRCLVAASLQAPITVQGHIRTSETIVHTDRAPPAEAS